MMMHFNNMIDVMIILYDRVSTKTNSNRVNRPSLVQEFLVSEFHEFNHWKKLDKYYQNIKTKKEEINKFEQLKNIYLRKQDTDPILNLDNFFHNFQEALHKVKKKIRMKTQKR